MVAAMIAGVWKALQYVFYTRLTFAYEKVTFWYPVTLHCIPNDFADDTQLHDYERRMI